MTTRPGRVQIHPAFETSANAGSVYLMSSSILYLDFDGVLHPASGRPEHLFCYAPRLADCLAGREVAIVISSSWRFQYSLQELRALLPRELAARVCGVTGDPVPGQHARWQEILIDVRQRGASVGQGPARWRALDDAFLEFPKNTPELILCHPQTGFGEAQFQALQEWLDAR